MRRRGVHSAMNPLNFTAAHERCHVRTAPRSVNERAQRKKSPCADVRFLEMRNVHRMPYVEIRIQASDRLTAEIDCQRSTAKCAD